MTTITLNGTLTLGRVLQLYRNSANLDQGQMGDLIGASRPTISAWERDLREPSFSQVVAWANITAQPLDALVEAATTKAPAGSAEASSLSQHSVRPKGLEPLTF